MELSVDRSRKDEIPPPRVSVLYTMSSARLETTSATNLQEESTASCYNVIFISDLCVWSTHEGSDRHIMTVKTYECEQNVSTTY